MNRLSTLLRITALLGLPLASIADPWKDEGGHGKGREHERREYKEEYWDGNCKVERKLEKGGEYKEERKCKGPRYGKHEGPSAYAPPPSPTYGGQRPRPYEPPPVYEDRNSNFPGAVKDPYLDRVR